MQRYFKTSSEEEDLNHFFEADYQKNSNKIYDDTNDRPSDEENNNSE